MTHLVVLCSFI